MKRIVLCLWLGALGLIPSFAQTPTDTVRAVLIGMNDLDKFIFTLEDGNGTLRVRLGGKPATIAPGFYALDQKPSFQGGGPNAFSKWVNAHLVYPQASRNYGSEGTVKLQFTIEKDGKLDDVKVVQSSGDQYLDDEAFRVVSSSPDWQPVALHGKPVKVTYTFPVIFQLQNKPKKENSHPSGWSTGR